MKPTCSFAHLSYRSSISLPRRVRVLKAYCLSSSATKSRSSMFDSAKLACDQIRSRYQRTVVVGTARDVARHSRDVSAGLCEALDATSFDRAAQGTGKARLEKAHPDHQRA